MNALCFQVALMWVNMRMGLPMGLPKDLDVDAISLQACIISSELSSSNLPCFVCGAFAQPHPNQKEMPS